MKVNGLKTDFAPMRNEGTRITICYGLKKVDGKLYEWHEIYLPKTQNANLSLDIVKTAILNDINKRVKTAIISGFVWNEKPVWLSEENQLNFSQAVVPATLKIGEQADGTPIYETFDTKTDLKAFNEACTLWKQQCLSEGYNEKDAIDWTPYEALFPEQTKTETAE
jgi:hypothetical protein